MMDLGQIKDKAFYQFLEDRGIIAKIIEVNHPYIFIRDENGNAYSYKLTKTNRIKKNSFRRDKY